MHGKRLCVIALVTISEAIFVRQGSQLEAIREGGVKWNMLNGDALGTGLVQRGREVVKREPQQLRTHPYTRIGRAERPRDMQGPPQERERPSASAPVNGLPSRCPRQRQVPAGAQDRLWFIWRYLFRYVSLLLFVACL